MNNTCVFIIKFVLYPKLITTAFLLEGIGPKIFLSNRQYKNLPQLQRSADTNEGRELTMLILVISDPEMSSLWSMFLYGRECTGSMYLLLQTILPLSIYCIGLCCLHNTAEQTVRQTFSFVF